MRKCGVQECMCMCVCVARVCMRCARVHKSV